MAATLRIEQDDDMIAAYDVNTEPPPNSPVYHQSFKVVTKRFDEILRLLREPLDESDYTDPNVEALISLLKNRGKARSPDEVRVALIGDMASGKSSLINSLLSVGILARKRDTGTSCTRVIQEFRANLPKQSTPFRAEIEYYSEAELETIITFLFKEAYASLPSSDGGSEVLDGGVSRLTAIKTIQTLFCDKAECASEEAIAATLSEASGETDKTFIQKMIIWSRELIRKYAKQDDGLISVVEHTTTQGLLQRLREYTFNGTDEDEFTEPVVSLWPLISRIK